jgi:hypothetical protein
MGWETGFDFLQYEGPNLLARVGSLQPERCKQRVCKIACKDAVSGKV